jgi:hypothetical protein
MCVGDRWAWVKALQEGDEGRGWPRVVWADFLGACALAALVAGLLTLARCG